MRTNLKYLRNENEETTSIELDELGILVNGMNDSYLHGYDQSVRSNLSTWQNRLIKDAAAKEIPVVVINYPGYGRISKSLEKSLSEYFMYETVSGHSFDNIAKALGKWEARNVILTGTDLFLRNLIDSISEQAIITSPRLLSGPHKNSLDTKTQIWLQNNTLYIPQHSNLLNLIYEK